MLVIVLPVTNLATEIIPDRLEEQGDTLFYFYDAKVGEAQSYSTQPISLIILDKKYADKQKLIDHNTHEFILGAEYDICKLMTVSASWETTRYGLGDAFMNDLSFNLSNNMIGGGLRINATNRLSIDLGYMCTFYNDREVTTPTAVGPKTDLYSRKNHTFGIGFNLDL